MVTMFRRHVVSEATARRVGWAAGFVILSACTTLVLKALPGFGVGASVGLVSAVAVAWVVVGAQFPAAVRAEPGAAADRAGTKRLRG